MTSPLVVFAREYARHGWAVVPLHAPNGVACDCRLGAACDSPAKHPWTEHGLTDASTDFAQIDAWWVRWPNANVGVAVPPGHVVVDLDAQVDGLVLPPTWLARTGRGHHYAYRTRRNVPPRVAVREHVDLRGPGSYIVAAPSLHANGTRYEWLTTFADMTDAPEWVYEGRERATDDAPGAPIADGERNASLASLAGSMRRRGMSAEGIYAALAAENAARCNPPLADDEVRLIARSVARYEPVVEAELVLDEPAPDPGSPEPEDWPDLPAEAAYHGVLGDIAQAVAPYTEADPVGLLGTLLAMFGAACGGDRWLYQGSMQRTNLSVLLVGETGFRGRKGTGLDVSRSVFGLAYPELADLWLVGVASGEAISGHLGRHDSEERVLLVEPEFGRLLTIMGRDGNTLSPVLRNAWDGVPLGHARARDESLVTRHHVTLLGHVTPVELRAKLTTVDAANGFVNRILLLAVRRTRLIPFPVAPDEHVRQFVEPLHRAIVEAHSPREMAFDEPARERWQEFYAELARTPRLGLAGAVTGRHEAQVARLALVYALADRSSAVGVAHLDAAIALADYARRSAIWALGDSTGNRHADVLRRMLEEGEIGWREAKLALGLRTAADMAEVVEVLVSAGLAEVVRVPREGPGGRPRQVVRGRAKGAKGAKGARGARTEDDEILT